MRNLKNILHAGLAFILFVAASTASATYVVTEKTPIVFSDKNIQVFEDVSNKATLQDVLSNLDRFAPANKISGFKPNVTYWVYQRIASELEYDREIRIDPTGWVELTAHVIDDKGMIQTLKPVGFVGLHNPYLNQGPQATPINKFPSQFPGFTLKKGAEVSIVTRMNFNPIFPSKTFSINFYDSITFGEFRRFSLYLEGLLLGVLFALTIFALFNAYQSGDKVNYYYALWISIALFSVSSLSVIDGHRLFEFFIDIEGLKSPGMENHAFVISIGLAFCQAISYVLFARQYLEIKKYFPKIYIATNAWIAFALL